MSQRRYGPFHSLIQRLASSRPGAWLLSHRLHYFDRAILRLTGGRTSLTSMLSGAPVVLVTMVGARSGLKRTLPLVPVHDEQDPDTLAFVASNWGQHEHPAWYYNVQASPRVTCSIRGRAMEYVAHEARGEEYEKWWRCAVETYSGFALYRQRTGGRHIPIIVMHPVQEHLC